MIALLLCALLLGDDLVWDGGRLGLPESVLTTSDIREQLDSGLTTTFLLTLGDAGRGALVAHIEVRYEPWDEVYFVELTESGGASRKLTFANFQKLSHWWSNPFVKVPSHGRADPGTITLLVIPFSHHERDEARRWLIGNPRPDQASGAVRQDGGPVMSSLLATSIRREPMRRYRWKVR